MLYFVSLIRRMAAGIRAGRSEGVVIMDACVSVGNHWLVDLDFGHCERLVYAAYRLGGFGVVVRARGNWSSFTLEEVPPFVDSACTHFP